MTSQPGSMLQLGEVSEMLARAMQQSEADQLYLCVWGDGYADPGEPKIELHPFSFFSIEQGYTQTDCKKIDALGFGESVTLIGLADVQSIFRVR